MPPIDTTVAGVETSRVTLTYNTSSEETTDHHLKLEASYPLVTVGGVLGFSKKTQSGNTVVTKFTQGGK
jgi:hypothetical protein